MFSFQSFKTKNIEKDFIYIILIKKCYHYYI